MNKYFSWVLLFPAVASCGFSATPSSNTSNQEAIALNETPSSSTSNQEAIASKETPSSSTSNQETIALKDKLVRVNPIIQNNVDMFVNTQLDILNNIDCDNYPSLPDCQPVKVHFNDGQFDPAKTDEQQTVLVIDYMGTDLQAILRYRSRVKAYLKLDSTKENGLMENPSLITSVAMKNVLNAVDRRTFAPAQAYRRLANAVDKKFLHSNFEIIGHGRVTLQYLMENNPRAEFVVVDLVSGFARMFKDQFCGSKFDDLRHRVQKVSNRLRFMIDEFGVEYVNFSGGVTLQRLRDSWQTVCKDHAMNHEFLERTLKMIGDEFYSVIFDTPGVLGVQSAPYSNELSQNSLDSNDPWRNRIKVGYLSGLESNLNQRGELDNASNKKPSLDHKMSQVYDITDVFISLGVQGFGRRAVTNNTTLMSYGYYGLKASPMADLATSWAAPAGLSYIIYLKNRLYNDRPLTNELITKLKQQLTPRGCYQWQPGICKLQDPLKFYFHEVYQLNYIIKSLR